MACVLYTSGLAAVWKDGCIIRSALLGRIEQAEELSGKPLILSAAFSDIGTLEGSLRKMAAAAVLSGMPLPCIQEMCIRDSGRTAVHKAEQQR